MAWRVHHLTKLGRETPDVPCTVFFKEHEWKGLLTYWARKPVFSDEPPTLRQAVRLTAKLGGFLGRKCDGNLEQRPFGLAFSDSTTSQACISSWLPLSSHIPKTHPCSATQVVGKDQAHDGRPTGSHTTNSHTNITEHQKF